MFDIRRLEGLKSRQIAKLTRSEQRAFEAFAAGVTVGMARQRLLDSKDRIEHERVARNEPEHYDLWLARDCPGIE